MDIMCLSRVIPGIHHYNAKYGLGSEWGHIETTRNSGSRLRQGLIIFLLEFTLGLVNPRTSGMSPAKQRYAAWVTFVARTHPRMGMAPKSTSLEGLCSNRD